MPTQTEVQEQAQVVDDLAALATDDLAEFWRTLDIEDTNATAAAVRDVTPAIAAQYALETSVVTADWYDQLRAEAAVATTYAAVTLAPPGEDQIQEALGYVLAPLFPRERDPEPTVVLDRLANLAEDVITSSGRQTVGVNAHLDKAAPRYARHASANACTFCLLLATRGADYRSKQSATRVVLSRPRNKRKLGEKFHDFCRCVSVPVWDRSAYEEAPYVADWRDAYDNAVSAVGGAKDVKAILAEMRKTLGTK